MSVEGRPLIEQELIQRARNGDVAAFEELVRMHQAIALRVAILVVGDRSDAEDVTQEAFVKAYHALGRFRQDSPFRPWLLRIVRNEALNQRRRHGRQDRLGLRLAGDRLSGDAAPSPETVVVSGSDRESVLAAVNGLPERYRHVIALRFLLGLSEAETAETLGIPAGTVKSRTARALSRLERVLSGVIEEVEHE
ncbi:MAG TPA: sigma-70 family RNA polymerase sigma factor [Acidimicrobiia bacterium]|nr:sigma-70 family RNA polymerase sigma factor [Acidimicrobiia bacterium]